MSHRYAIVKGGVVEGVCLWDGESEWEAPSGSQLIPADGTNAAPGDDYDGANFVKQVVPERVKTPEELQREADYQSAKDKLIALGLTEAEVRHIL